MPQSGGVETFTLGAYARRDGRIVFVDGAAAATYAAIDSKRRFAGQTATGNSDATGAGVMAGIGAVLRAGALTLEPRIGLDYDHNRQNGFTERGAGAANLHIGGEARDALRGNVGTRLHTVWEVGSDAAFMPEFSIAWAHNLVESAVKIRERAKDAAIGEQAPKDFLLLGIGLSYHPNASNEIFVRYDGAFARDMQADAISAGGKLRW